MTRSQVILQMSDADYEKVVFDIWFKWCLNRAIDDSEFQSLLSSPGINKWFLKEMEFFENQFVERIRPFIGNASKGTILKSYYQTVERIYSNWPKPVVDRVRRETHRIDLSQITNYPN